MDNLSKSERHKVMSKIKHSGTMPEKKLRRLFLSFKTKSEFNTKDVLGKPDIIIRNKKLAIFIDGCFWHGCKICRSVPKTNHDFWKRKITYNKKRRELVKKTLQKEGWVVLEFWEHEVNNSIDKVESKIIRTLNRRQNRLTQVFG